MTGLPSDHSSQVNIFSLPREIRVQIYKQILIVDHPVFLFQDASSRVETFAPDRPVRWLSIMYTTRQLHRETSSILYGMNVFNLVDSTSNQTKLLQDFLNSIGRVNASTLSHLCINFPKIDCVQGDTGQFELTKESLQSFMLLQDRLNSLKILETSIYSKETLGLNGLDLNDGYAIAKALSLVEMQVKNIPRLSRFIVRVFDPNLDTPIIETMQGLGWIIMRSHGKWHQ